MSSAGKARQTSVHSPAMMILRRPVASMAARNSGSSHALTPVRSIWSTPGSSFMIWGTVGALTPMPTATVETIVGMS